MFVSFVWHSLQHTHRTNFGRERAHTFLANGHSSPFSVTQMHQEKERKQCEKSPLLSRKTHQNTPY